MQKLLALLWIYAALSIPLGAQTGSASLNRKNVSEILNFEKTEKNGHLLRWGGGPQQTIFIDHEIVHKGTASVRLERQNDSPNSFTAINAVIPVDFAGKEVQLSGYIKTENVEQFVGLWLRQDGSSGTLALNNMQEQAVHGTNDWKQYSITLPVNPEARQLVFGVLLSGSGKAWADDLQLLVDGKPIAEAPTAPPHIPTVFNRDHEFDAGSKITLQQLTPLQIDSLVTLARVWGFLKYHHPAIADGHHHWDYDLFRILPETLNAHNRAEANHLLAHWIDGLGEVAPCKPCAEENKADSALAPDLAWISDTNLLGEALSKRLQHIYRNRPIGKQFYVSFVPKVGNPVFDHELTYADIPFPDPGFQLLALFRFWNILQYWYPYRDVAQKHWPDVLRTFIPQMALANSKTEYEKSLLAFTTQINDTHANLWNSLSVRPPIGSCQLPVNFQFIQGKPVIVSFASDALSSASGLQIGDTLEQIDGLSLQTLIHEWSPFYADSNEPTRLRDISRELSNGTCGPVKINVLRNQKPVTLTATRFSRKQLDKIRRTHNRPGDTFQLLSKDVAYIKLSSIKAADVTSYIQRAEGTKGLIVDIRNYPSEFVPFALGSLLISQPTPFARFTKLQIDNPGAFIWTDAVSISPSQPHYNGKVVILVDEVSQSQAEYTAMALQAAPNAITVGSQTAGADGNVSSIPLPGNLRSMISGIGVFYPNKQPTQRVGVHIDVRVEPTEMGIRKGKDELLEEAIRQILKHEN